MSVGRTNDRMMRVKLGIEETVVKVICAYAPQVGCEEEEKETFWRQMDHAQGNTRKSQGDCRRRLKWSRGDQ